MGLPAASLNASFTALVAKTPVRMRAQRAARAVHAEGVQRIVVAEPAL